MGLAPQLIKFNLLAIGSLVTGTCHLCTFRSALLYYSGCQTHHGAYDGVVGITVMEGDTCEHVLTNIYVSRLKGNSLGVCMLGY
jgi:hypothetical protein